VEIILNICKYNKKINFFANQKRQKTVLAKAIALILLAGNVVPTSGLAVPIEGVKFIDSNKNDTWEPWENELPIVTGGIIRLKAANAPSRLRPAQERTDINGQYVFDNVRPGDYKIWQYLDPTSSLANAVREDGETPLVLWSSEENPLWIRIKENSQVIKLVVDENGIDFAWEEGEFYDTDGNGIVNIDFPTPELGDDVQTKLEKATNIATNICSMPTVTLYSSWFENGDINEDSVVAIYGEIGDIPDSSPPVEVRAICNYGTLIDGNGSGLTLTFRELFANYGEIKGINGEENYWSLGGGYHEGTSLLLQDNPDVTCDPTDSPDPDYCSFFGIFYNDGKIQAGNGQASSGDSYNTAGEGGSVTIFAGIVMQQGTIAAGNGGNAEFPNRSYEVQDGKKLGGQGGELLIGAASDVIATAQSYTASGNGGDVVVQNGACSEQNHTDGLCGPLEALGGDGGDLSVWAGINMVAEGTAYSGNSAYFEPDVMLSGQDTRIIAKEDVVIFGGDDWELKLNNLSDEAITAGRNIILAVGNGGIVDLRNNNSKVFKAAAKVEIFADTILLDEGVMLQDLIDAPSIEVNPSKIIYHVALSGRKQIEAEANTNLPIEISISNVGPKEDTYTLGVSDSDDWAITGLPSTVTVEGLKRKSLILNVTLPSTMGAKDVITITATSQTDSKVIAVMDIKVSVKDTSCRVWGVHDKGLNNSQLFTVHSTDLQNFEVVELGNLQAGYDLESLDINPLTGELYMASSTDGVEPGHLYKLNPNNEAGNLVSVGNIGFTQVDSLSFHPEGVLWGWERGQGLLQINSITGIGELVIPYTEDVEDISWSTDGKLLYAVQHNELLVWDGNTLTTLCSMPRETEGIEAISENMLMFGAHGDKHLYVIDVKNGCQEINNISTPYNDIEGIAWSASTCPIQ
jgi:hypothetical protein